MAVLWSSLRNQLRTHNNDSSCCAVTQSDEKLGFLGASGPPLCGRCISTNFVHSQILYRDSSDFHAVLCAVFVATSPAPQRRPALRRVRGSERDFSWGRRVTCPPVYSIMGVLEHQLQFLRLFARPFPNRADSRRPLGPHNAPHRARFTAPATERFS